MLFDDPSRFRLDRRGADGRWSGPDGASAWPPGVCGRASRLSGNGRILTLAARHRLSR